jgi:hypothetical protein
VDDAVSEPALLLDRRIRSVLDAAELRETGVALDDLAELLPPDAPGTSEALSEWLRDRPEVATIIENRVYRSREAAAVDRSEDRRRRSERYVAAAEGLIRSTFAEARPLFLSVSVTGSTAYGGTEEGEDCDLLVVARRGAIWAMLTYAYLRLRFLSGSARRDPPPVWCLNYVLDDAAAREDFGAPRGFLFAREALSARPVHGESYYRELLGEAPWMGTEAPRLYARWGPFAPATDPPAPAPVAVRLLNALLFPPVAAYLQVVGLYRNALYRREGRAEERFRTITLPARLEIHSEKFSRMLDLYRGASVTPPEAGARPHGSFGEGSGPTWRA